MTGDCPGGGGALASPLLNISLASRPSPSPAPPRYAVAARLGELIEQIEYDDWNMPPEVGGR